MYAETLSLPLSSKEGRRQRRRQLYRVGWGASIYGTLDPEGESLADFLSNHRATLSLRRMVDQEELCVELLVKGLGGRPSSRKWILCPGKNYALLRDEETWHDAPSHPVEVRELTTHKDGFWFPRHIQATHFHRHPSLNLVRPQFRSTVQVTSVECGEDVYPGSTSGLED